MSPIRRTARQIERFVIYRVLHVDDTPHRLALGIALGIFIAWTPTIGFQMVLVLLLAPILRANGRVGIPLVWISNPLTLALIYYPNYLLGRYMLGVFVERPSLGFNYQQLREILGTVHGVGYMLRHFFEIDFWRNLGELLLNMGFDLWVGSVVMGFIFGGISYIASHRFIIWYRTHNPIGRLHFQRMLRRKKDKNICQKTTTKGKTTDR